MQGSESAGMRAPSELELHLLTNRLIFQPNVPIEVLRSYVSQTVLRLAASGIRLGPDDVATVLTSHVECLTPSQLRVVGELLDVDEVAVTAAFEKTLENEYPADSRAWLTLVPNFVALYQAAGIGGRGPDNALAVQILEILKRIWPPHRAEILDKLLVDLGHWPPISFATGAESERRAGRGVGWTKADGLSPVAEVFFNRQRQLKLKPREARPIYVSQVVGEDPLIGADALRAVCTHTMAYLDRNFLEVVWYREFFGELWRSDQAMEMWARDILFKSDDGGAKEDEELRRVYGISLYQLARCEDLDPDREPTVAELADIENSEEKHDGTDTE